MKKSIFLLALSAAVAFGAASCSKTSENNPETGTAKLTIEYGFSKSVEGRAPESNAKPATNWNANIKSLTLILTNTSGTILRVENPDPPTESGMAMKTISTLAGIASGDYNVYLIANASSAVTSSPHGATGISSSYELTQSALLNKNISLLTFSMVAATGMPTGDPAITACKEPTEIFWAKTASPITISGASETATLHLERYVSLLRIRINKNVAGYEFNSGIDFTTADASMLLRRTKGSNIMASSGAVTGASTAIFSKKPFKTANPASTEYNPVNMGLGTAGTDDFSCWNDYLILPGGDTGPNAVNTGFNLLLVGTAPVGYVPIGNDGNEKPAISGSPKPVFWVAGVNGAVAHNGIMEINVKLQSRGIDDVILPPVNYGDLMIEADLLGWGAVESVTLPM